MRKQMNDLTIFNSSEFGEIRTVTIDGKPYFVAVDVAAALGYATPRDAISRSEEHTSELQSR